MTRQLRLESKVLLGDDTQNARKQAFEMVKVLLAASVSRLTCIEHTRHYSHSPLESHRKITVEIIRNKCKIHPEKIVTEQNYCSSKNLLKF